ncbi:MAG TPA: HD domain-containing phosphohydrolase [Bryobacteraceae bacterium]|nr:HD domain-containing phosphohydrolase [Bryobacteraceae bacterium]
MSIPARIFIGLVLFTGLASLLQAFSEDVTTGLPRFLCYLILALVSSGLKVTLPGVTGTMSVFFLFILLGVAELNILQTMILGLSAALVQCFWGAKVRPNGLQILFNLAAIATAIAVAFSAYHSPLAPALGNSLPIMLMLSATAYFMANTLAVACVIALTERRALHKIWKECYFWSFPYYLLGATLVCLISYINKSMGWQFSLTVLPVCYVIYRSYHLYLGRLETEKAHVEQMNSLHLRTIEALALAIEAKDQTTRAHLQRVQHYAVKIGQILGIEDMELEALRAAAVLHDIGKLAVPEHIISKPGKLTMQEFEKMKIHPLVGAEILEKVDFPYPVAPIVRAHHEKWDGTGYPLGLRGEEIPLGARILAAVDCLDALASDRQYRRAVSLHEAMDVVIGESGKSYDPRVVAVLKSHYRELEEEAKLDKNKTRPSTEFKVTRGGGPATGVERASTDDYVAQIAAAGQEAQFMLQLVKDLGNSLNLVETLSVLAQRLKAMISFDAIAVYECRAGLLIPAYVEGQDQILFSSLAIPIGEGLSGWVAKHNKAVINGNPSVEPGYLNNPSKFSVLRSALAVPLEAMNGVVGVLTLYHARADAFSPDQLRILSGISSKVGLCIENTLKYQELESFATTDHLTGLANTRSLFPRLESELARSKRQMVPFTVLVCDLDGFKQVNDRFGHVTGNLVLQLFSKGLKESSREYDVVARLGGDEFVVAMPGMAVDAVEEKVQAMSRLAREAGIEACGEETVTLSVGYASFPDDSTDSDTLLAEADRRMYNMKKLSKSSRSRMPLGEGRATLVH